MDSLALIGSSIVSKKAATGAGHLLYDVKCGSGAFMKTPEQARELAELLVALSESMGVRSSALITDMDAALGRAVGNALEVRESLEFLRGEPTSPDLADVARDVARRLLELSGVPGPEAAASVERALDCGAAYETFAAFVRAQGGDAGALDDLAVSRSIREVVAPGAGHVARFDALGIGRAAVALGAGRERKSDRLDFGAGIDVLVAPGEEVAAGQPVARLYGERLIDRAQELVQEALELSGEPVEPRPHVLASL